MIEKQKKLNLLQANIIREEETADQEKIEKPTVIFNILCKQENKCRTLTYEIDVHVNYSKQAAKKGFLFHIVRGLSRTNFTESTLYNLR